MERRKISVRSMMKKSIKLFLVMLYITTIIAMIAGGITAGTMTLLPPEDFGWTVSKMNYLGYRSICAFAPFSTIMLFGMAFIGLILLIKFIKYIRRKAKNSKAYTKLKILINKVR
ncbi:MAG: hypothetical protein ACFFCI_19115 [Promethearchaeota archaeon]